MSSLSLQEKATRLIRESVEAGEVAGANILVYQEGREALYTEYGWQNIEEKTPIRRDTIFRLYSMSKPITSAAVMILLDRGLIDLADPVEKYLSGFANGMVNENGVRSAVRRPVTIKDLLSMSSGLVYPGELTAADRQMAVLFKEIDRRLYTEEAMTTVEICQEIGRCDLLFQPGSHFRYGTSADVLGAIVEIVSGKRFGEFLQEEIFAPLGMEDTGFYVPAQKQNRLASVYRCENGRMTEEKTNHLGIRYTMDCAPAFESGGAGLVSTLDDYAKFAQMLFRGGQAEGHCILSEPVVRFMCSGRLLDCQQADYERDWVYLTGFTYGNLMRVMEEPGRGVGLSVRGEYGWDGWLGPYFTNAPHEKITILMGMQKIDAGTWSLTRKLRNAVYSELLS